MQLLKASLPAALILLSTGAHAQDNSEDNLPEGVLASVNGRPIPQLSVDNVAQQITDSGQQAEPEQILEELINLEVLTQAAEELELDKQAEVSATLQLQYTQTMANAYLASKGAEMSFSDEELRAEYDAQSAAADRAEFLASHILLESEEDAAKVLEQLAADKDFAELAGQYSIDPTGESGGDLGWFQSSTMVPEFADAIAAMEVGDVSTTPVESQYGFHIIKLMDKRNAALPDFEAVKPGLTNLLVRKALAEHVDALKAAADIKAR